MQIRFAPELTDKIISTHAAELDRHAKALQAQADDKRAQANAKQTELFGLPVDKANASRRERINNAIKTLREDERDALTALRAVETERDKDLGDGK